MYATCTYMYIVHVYMYMYIVFKPDFQCLHKKVFMNINNLVIFSKKNFHNTTWPICK